MPRLPRVSGPKASAALRWLIGKALKREDADWVFSDRRSVLADCDPEDEGLHNDGEALSATSME